MATRRELKDAIRERYQGAAGRPERRQILSEFVRVTGYHRKHALRVLNHSPTSPSPRRRERLYDEAVHQALTELWEAADRICGKRLRVLIPVLIEAMERHGHLKLDRVVRSRLLEVSAATIDRLLSPEREATGRARRRRWGAGSAVRHRVPVRTFADWGDPAPGYFECDMVENCGGVKKDGNFVHTLTVTDIHSGWTECAALAVREQSLVVEGLSAIARVLPFALSGLDTDNDSAFMNETLQSYCNQHRIEWTRSRAYHKNDQAWVEQKNGAVVRRLAGYGRLSGLAAASSLQRLYESARLYVNFFQPSFKLASKQREGAVVHKRYHPPLAPYQRLLASDAVDETVKQRLREQFAVLDPVALLKTIRGVQQDQRRRRPGPTRVLRRIRDRVAQRLPRAQGAEKDDHQALVENPRRSVRGELAVGGRLADGGTQSHRQGTADAAEPALARPLPHGRTTPDPAEAGEGVAHTVGPTARVRCDCRPASSP